LAPLRLRVCLIGPECTGKTTLAEELSRHFNAPWVPEFAREYAERVARELTADDVEPIARGELALIDAAPNADLVILDTDLISTVVYARHYYGSCPEWIEREARTRKADLYLLTDIDLPWVPDSLRDSAAPRESLYKQFAQILKDYEANFVAIKGDRFEAAVTQLNSLRDRPPATKYNPHR
jgi:NadR type nicotinamide-nucleotide adenylyltransferase